MERMPGADDPQRDMEYGDSRARPDAEMARGALVHEAGFVVAAAALNGPDWVIRTERVRGQPRSIIDNLPYYLTDDQSIRHVVALLASAVAQGQGGAAGHGEVLGQASVGRPRW